MKEKNFQRMLHLFDVNHRLILILKMNDLKVICKEMKVKIKIAKSQPQFKDLCETWQVQMK